MTYKMIPLDWPNIEVDDIPAGTPIGLDGQIHNDAQAYGILADPCNRNWDGRGRVQCNGYYDESDLAVELTDAARQALHNFKFVNNGLVSAIPVTAELPTFSIEDAGKVLAVGEDGKLTWIELETNTGDGDGDGEPEG